MGLRVRAAQQGGDEGAGDEEDVVYDYSTEKVRSLLKRDSGELKGLDPLGGVGAKELEEGSKEDAAGAAAAAAASTPPPAEPKNPFAGGAIADPFAAGTTKSPFASGAEGTPFSGTSAGAAGGAAPGPKSPFQSGASGAGGVGGGGLNSPFKADAQDMDVMGTYDGEERPWWQPKITATQIVIVLSFITITSLMLLTFAVVFKSGGVRFNE